MSGGGYAAPGKVLIIRWGLRPKGAWPQNFLGQALAGQSPRLEANSGGEAVARMSGTLLGIVTSLDPGPWLLLRL